MPLKAYCNGYEVIAASTEDEARDILRAMNIYDAEEDLDGEGWSVLNDADMILDEDGTPTGETVGALVVALGKPGHLWSCEV